MSGVLAQGKEPKCDAEVLRILHAAANCSSEHLLFCLIILESGLRPSEVEHLPWEFIEVEDPAKAQIRLPLKHSIDIKGQHLYDFEVKSSRRSGQTVVQISKLSLVFGRILKGIKAKQHGRYVFSDWIRETPSATRSVLYRKLGDINEELSEGADSFQFKNFRDTNVNLRLSRGEKLEHIAKQLGHRSFYFTYERYFHLIDGDVDLYPKYEEYLLQLLECQWKQKLLKNLLEND